LLQYLDAERTSLKQRRAISPTTTAAPYWGSPKSVVMEIALEEIADVTILIRIIMPPFSCVNLLYILINYKIKLLYSIKNFCQISGDLQILLIDKRQRILY
jgi:hypothetical protein